MPDITQEDWDAVAQERDGATQAAPPTETPPVQEAVDPIEQSAAQATEPKEDLPARDPELLEKLKRLDELTELFPRLVNELKATQGRVGALQSQHDRARQTSDAPSHAQVAAAAKSPEKWEALKKDFPEWGDAISDFVKAEVGAVAARPGGPTKEEIEQMVAQRAAEAAAPLQKKLTEALVTAAHRNWKQEVKTDGFKAWYAAQPREVQALADSDDAEDAIRMLDLWVENKAKPAERVVETRAQRLAAAATAKPTGTSVAVSKKFEDMTPQEQWEYLAREREKRNSG